MIQVALVGFGDHIPVNLSILVRKLNKLSGAFHFTKELSVPINKLGEPEKSGIWHFTDVFFKLLEANLYAKYDHVIGITDVRITRRIGYPDDIETDYFSDQDYFKIGIVSLNREVYRHNPATKDAYQYTALAIAEILVGNIVQKDIHHDLLNRCLLHDCTDRSAFASNIEHSVICAPCLAIITNATSGEIVNDIQNILGWCRRYSGEQSPVKSTLRNPFSAFVFGSGIGWLISSFLPSNANWAKLTTLAATILIPVATLTWYQFKNTKRSSNRTER